MEVFDSEDSPFLVGETNFETFSEVEGVYVDKTGLIHDLISGKKSTVPVFLTRPRRFGKTLLLDTIGNIFEGRRELFSGLEIHRRLGDLWETFPVIRLSFNSISDDPETFEDDLLVSIKTIARIRKIELESKSPSAAISELIAMLSAEHRFLQPPDISRLTLGNPFRNVVLLIDEYDFPLVGNIGVRTDLEKIRLSLHKFYSSVKSCSKFLRFVFITGITKFRQLSVFSGMNNTRDISLTEKYATICGFTEDEINSAFENYFEQTLDALKKKNQISKESTPLDLIKLMMEWYNGYSWDGKSRVLNPWSVLSFFSEQSLGNYWYESGSSLLTSNITQNRTDYFKVFDKNLTMVSPYPVMDIDNMDSTAVLMQAGYLTIDRITQLAPKPKYSLKIPNNEIFKSIRLEILEHMIVPSNEDDPELYLNQKYMGFLKAFGSRDEKECERYLFTILSSIYQRDPGNSPNESYFRSLLQLLIEFGNDLALPELPSDIGKSDLSIKTPKGDWVVIEIKFAKSESPETDTTVPEIITDNDGNIAIGNKPEFVQRILDKKINDSFLQIVNKNYASKFIASDFDVHAAAIAIYGTSYVTVRFRQIVWKDGK
ncbi:MAG: AAA family ATPase [Deltaproteobacteria bacterium]|jgi:hypothetical protein|nr:AAA family ATPase [Deltaproteobacteria bacterium]